MNPSNAFAQVIEAGNAHNRAREYLLRQISEDDPAFADTLEGMTELPDLIDRLMLHARIRKAEAEGLKSVIEEITARMKAGIEYEKRARDTVFAAMEQAGEKTIKGQTGTYTIKATAARVDIPDNDAVPTDYCKQVIKYLPDREKIEEALAGGAAFNWVTIIPPGRTIQVRAK